jgi:hypothetical protein
MDNVCVNSCPLDYQFGDPNDFKCKWCEQSCQYCTVTAINCNKCKGGIFQDGTICYP